MRDDLEVFSKDTWFRGKKIRTEQNIINLWTKVFFDVNEQNQMLRAIQ